MIIPDANLLIYAYNQDCKQNERAAAWWSDCLSSQEIVGIPQIVIFAFIRISTSSKIFPSPLSSQLACQIVEEWLALDHVTVLHTDDAFLRRVMELIQNSGSSGNITTDAQIAVHAIQHKAMIHINDKDFLRFSQVTFFNPLK